VFDVEHAAGGRDHGQAVAVEVGVGHQGVDGGEHLLAGALAGGLVTDRAPPLLRPLGGVVDARLSGQLQAQEGPDGFGQVDQVRGVGGDLRGESGSFHGAFLPRDSGGHARQAILRRWAR
jgi:hypothetical protein